jgi:hypothetical protein
LALRLLERPHPGWTVRRAADVIRWRKREQALAAELARCEALAEDIRTVLERAVDR